MSCSPKWLYRTNVRAHVSKHSILTIFPQDYIIFLNIFERKSHRKTLHPSSQCFCVLKLLTVEEEDHASQVPLHQFIGEKQA
jgi:hypothetical protein